MRRLIVLFRGVLGNVVVTWSPGPWVVRGFGGGDLQALVRAACN